MVNKVVYITLSYLAYLECIDSVCNRGFLYVVFSVIPNQSQPEYAHTKHEHSMDLIWEPLNFEHFAWMLFVKTKFSTIVQVRKFI